MHPSCRSLRTVLLLVAAAVPGCTGDGPSDSQVSSESQAPQASLVRLLSDGSVVFGIFPGAATPEDGAERGRNRELDFVFYSLESGPFDIPTMAAYQAGVAAGAAPEPPPPLVLRVPPVRDGAEQARANVAEAVAAGVAGIVFPHVESEGDATAAVSAMGDASWPGNPDGSLVNMLIVEDRAGVERVHEIVATPGVSVVFAGPGDLRRSYEGDMTAVEDAIQAVLAACVAHDVPCGITAGPEDVARRIEEGFRVFIVTDPAAVTAGREAAGRR